MDIRPILSTLSRHKTAASLIVLEIALTCAIICNAVFLIAQRLERMDRPTGMADSELVRINVAGIDYRQGVEDRTDALCASVWRTFGEDLTRRFLAIVEPVGERFLRHIDETAGDFWMPAARARRR